MIAELDRRLQYGPGMRVQRMVEAALLIGTFFTGDLRLAYVVLASTVLQTLSPRFVPVALVVSAFVRSPAEHRLSDLYFDFAGTRGACVLAPTVGFCCGCAVYVGMRELLVRAGIAKRYAHGACDIETTPRRQ